MKTIRESRVRGVLGLSILARLPEAMLGVGLLVHTQRLTGSFAIAGVVVAAYGLAAGIGGPTLGRLVDRRRQTLVLATTAGLQALLLSALALAPGGAPAAALVLLAAGIGLATPPVGACLRAALPSLVPDAGLRDRMYTLETSIVELTWVVGPPFVLGLGALWSTGGALAATGMIGLTATIAFAARPAARRQRPAVTAGRPRARMPWTREVRTLAVALLALGVLVGADEVGVTAAARSLRGSTTPAAPLLALWAGGSFCGGLLLSRLRSAQTRSVDLLLGLVALAVGGLALIPAATSVAALAVVLFGAGMAIAPTESAAYALVDRAAPASALAEAFSWLFTAVAVGAAAGAAGAGVLADRFGPAGAFALGASGCAGAALVTLLGGGTISFASVRAERRRRVRRDPLARPSAVVLERAPEG